MQSIVSNLEEKQEPKKTRSIQQKIETEKEYKKQDKQKKWESNICNGMLWVCVCVCVCVCVFMRAQSCPTLCNSMDCSPAKFFVHEILQAWILAWVAILLQGTFPT